MSWFPTKPPVNTDANDFSFKRWFTAMYRFAKGETRAELSKTAAFTPDENFLYPVNATSAAVTVTLPLAANYAYKKYTFKKTDASANAVTIQRGGTDTIDGATSKTLAAQYDWIIVFSDGISTWYAISSSTGGTGPTGAGGAPGPAIALDSGGVSEDGWVIPGPPGNPGAAGAAGAAGPAGAVVVMATEDGEEGPIGPPGISATLSTGGVLWITMVGGGGGGQTSTAAATPGHGGGSGEAVQGLMIKLTPGSSVSYSVGSGGAADTNGGDTNFGAFYCRGGKTAAGGNSGAGGGSGGAAGVAAANPGATGLLGGIESALYFGGSSGGARGSGTTADGGPGGGSGGFVLGGVGGVAGGAQGGGGGGAATIYGIGGAGGAGGAVGSNAPATNYGSGGGGGGGFSTGKAGGTGANGYLLVAWIGGGVELTGSSNFTVPS